MSLNPDQFRFIEDISQLIMWVYDHPGWTLAGGEMWRPPQMAELYAESGMGIKDSLHLKSLAWDVRFFVDGVYQTDSEAYRPLGEYWKSLSPQNRWGGDFTTRKDGNHIERVPA